MFRPEAVCYSRAMTYSPNTPERENVAAAITFLFKHVIMLHNQLDAIQRAVVDAGVVREEVIERLYDARRRDADEAITLEEMVQRLADFKGPVQ